MKALHIATAIVSLSKHTWACLQQSALICMHVLRSARPRTLGFLRSQLDAQGDLVVGPALFRLGGDVGKAPERTHCIAKACSDFLGW